MILLDTNVISEPWKPVPEPRVLIWIDGQAIETLFLSAVTVAELRFGIGAMPAGRRRSVRQIGSIPKSSRWASMNAIIIPRGGRAPPSQNTPTPCAGSRWPAAIPLPRAQAP